MQVIKDPETREAIAVLIGFVAGAAVSLIGLIIMMCGDNPRGDSFSLALTAVDGFIINPAATVAAGSPPGGAPPLAPSFNLTLYVENTRILGESCFSHGQAALSYDGVAVGEATVPGWCAGAKGTAKVEAVARSGRGVQLPDRLRRRMEAELRWGATQLDVEAKLFRYPYDETPPVLLRCKAVGPQLPAQPLPCQAYAAVELF